MTRNTRENRTGYWLLGLLVSAALVASGCSGSEVPATIPVEGKVTLAGRPISQGTVTFQPVNVAEGFPKRPGTGVINPDGTYRLSTFKEGDGAVPGEYKVLVATMTSGPTLEDPSIPEVWAAPKKYADPNQSPLTANVPADQSGTLVVDLALE